MSNSYMTVKQLSEYLTIQSSTLYSWVAQGKIPHVRIHGLIRFRPEEIEAWVGSYRKGPPEIPSVGPRRKVLGNIDTLIARAKREVYNTPQGETRPISSAKKGGRNGAI